MSTKENNAAMGSGTGEPGTDQLTKLLNVLLDISGILLGIFLVGVGIWALHQGYDPLILWWAVILCGIAAFLIHLFRYIGWNARRFFGLR